MAAKASADRNRARADREREENRGLEGDPTDRLQGRVGFGYIPLSPSYPPVPCPFPRRASRALPSTTSSQASRDGLSLPSSTYIHTRPQLAMVLLKPLPGVPAAAATPRLASFRPCVTIPEPPTCGVVFATHEWFSQQKKKTPHRPRIRTFRLPYAGAWKKIAKMQTWGAAARRPLTDDGMRERGVGGTYLSRYAGNLARPDFRASQLRPRARQEGKLGER